MGHSGIREEAETLRMCQSPTCVLEYTPAAARIPSPPCMQLPACGTGISTCLESTELLAESDPMESWPLDHEVRCWEPTVSVQRASWWGGGGEGRSSDSECAKVQSSEAQISPANMVGHNFVQ
eukprot:CAMPEP_0115416494 /NCGR_PEP_ID=MMETSP0271-20121206/23643_1 /TAXON_ID=71861 /ORGANISM="Scrippsiella trochoidea, Strain CCMP3099" /LENGTH=122 /DNA_ID=CAMNT_0002840863 /DNA_START=618 /DNA_END=986 /DNA_ORIENTATION=+